MKSENGRYFWNCKGYYWKTFGNTSLKLAKQCKKRIQKDLAWKNS